MNVVTSDMKQLFKNAKDQGLTFVERDKRTGEIVGYKMEQCFTWLDTTPKGWYWLRDMIND